MINQELDAYYSKRPIPDVHELMDKRDIDGFKAFVATLASHANRYNIHDITAFMAINHIRRELIDRNMEDEVQPEWGKAERKVMAVHREQQQRIQGWFNGNKKPSPYK